jgi:hypothetical protein
VGLVANVIVSRAIDADVVEAFGLQPDIAAMLIGHDGCAGRGVVADELLQRLGLGVLQGDGADLAGLISDVDDGDSAHGAENGAQLVLRMLVLLARGSRLSASTAPVRTVKCVQQSQQR